MQDLTLDNQDFVFHNSGLHLQDFINDSRLKIINVSQDSTLSIQDTSLPDLNSSMQEQFIQDLRSDNLTELTVPSVCESDTPFNPHDTTADVLSFKADVSLSSPQEHSTVTFKDSNVASFSSLLDHPISNAFRPDQVVCKFLAFGWPIGFDYSCCGVVSCREFRNHKGALDFPSAVDSYLSTELMFSSVCGPFAWSFFSAGHMAVSPLNSVPKNDLDERRFILDLSWPAGLSVNDGISKDFYLGQPVTLRYPTVDDIAERISGPVACYANVISNAHIDSYQWIHMIILC